MKHVTTLLLSCLFAMVATAAHGHEGDDADHSGSDEASHDGNLRAKIDIIERADTVINQFIDAVDFIVITADHTTPVNFKNHTADPVPVVISGPGVRTDDVKTFGERTAAKGGLGRILGKNLIPIITDLMGKSHKFGA